MAPRTIPVRRRGVEASSRGWVVDVLLNRKGRALHCTTKTKMGESLGGPLLGSPGISTVAYLAMRNRNLEYGERRCGCNIKHQITKAPRGSPFSRSRAICRSLLRGEVFTYVGLFQNLNDQTNFISTFLFGEKRSFVVFANE